MNDLQARIAVFMSNHGWRKIRVSSLAERLGVDLEEFAISLSGGDRFVMNGEWLVDTSQCQVASDIGEAQKTAGAA